jgi:hypothetical protein
MPCPICGAAREPALTNRLLGKYDVQYVLCDGCGLLQTEPPYWLDEAYSEPITRADVGLVQRNLWATARVGAILHHVLPDGRYLDIGAGTGLMVRMLRDRGFDFYWSDAYAENWLARGFEDVPGNRPYTALAAFEVMEHVTDPLAFVQQAFQDSGCRTLIFSEELFEGAPPAPGWHYYSVETGQHVSLYQRRTLLALADRLGVHLHSSGTLHMLTDHQVSDRRFRLCAGRAAPLLTKLASRSRPWLNDAAVAAPPALDAPAAR